LDLLTWQSRRIRLMPEIDAAGATAVSRVVLAAGDRLDQVPMDVEPHTAWQRVDKPKAGQLPNRPVRHVPGRAVWHGLEPLLATRADLGQGVSSSTILLGQLDSLRANGYVPEELRLQVLTVGVQYGNKSAVVEEVMADQIPLPLAALDPSSDVRRLLEDVVSQAEELRRAVDRLGDNLRQAAGGDPLPWDKSQRLGDLFIHRINQVVRRLLGGLQRYPDAVDDADKAWRQMAAAVALEVAEQVLADTPPAAFYGRKKEERLGKRERIYRASVAEQWYRAAVHRVLGLGGRDGGS
jgi:CRISPR system Cascade subunit CasA